MIPVPEWAPNVHPMIVHFPIALLTVAVMLDALVVLVRRWVGLRDLVVLLFALGAAAAVVTYFTGRAAADGLLLPSTAETTLTDHADWALRTVLFYAVYAVLRAAMLWSERKTWVRPRLAADALLFIIGAAGLWLVVETGDRGAMMVYRYGVGVQSAEQAELVEHRHDEHDEEHLDTGDGGAVGSRSFDAGAHEAGSPLGALNVIEGDAGSVTYVAADSSLAFSADSGPVLAVLPDTLAGVRIDLEADLSGLAGTFEIRHHIRAQDAYDFVSFGAGTVRQGRVDHGEMRIFDESPVETADGWQAIRVVSDGRHFRTYVDGQVVVHGHGPPPEPGPIGLRVDGTGSGRLRRLHVVALG